MKTTIIIILTSLVVFFSSVISAISKDSTDSIKMETLIDSLSYCMGVQTANFLEIDGSKFNYETFKKGMLDALAKHSLIDDEQIGTVMRRFMEEQKNKMSEINLAEGNKFLAEDKTKPGVKTTESGLQYKVIKEGTGPKPTAKEIVKVHYNGTLINGEVFDSSVQRGEPIDIPLSSVIPGWTEGIPLMAVGSKFKFFVPPDLGYGQNGMGPIGPNQCLIFDVELLEIVKNTDMQDTNVDDEEGNFEE